MCKLYLWSVRSGLGCYTVLYSVQVVFVVCMIMFGLLYSVIQCVNCICGLYDQVWVVVQCYTMCKLYLWPVPLGLGCFGPS